MPSLPITFIKTDSDNSYSIKQVPHPSTQQQQQQNVFMSSSSTIAAAHKRETCENNIISNFKNLQKNLELIEQQHHHHQHQHVGGYNQRTSQGATRFVVDDSDEDQAEVIEDDDDDGLAMFDDDDDITLSPLEWDCNDVLEFLKRSNCSQHCEIFMKNKIDGKKLLQLTQNEIIQLLGMKVGPAIKIYDLIQQIKVKVAPYMGGNSAAANVSNAGMMK